MIGKITGFLREKSAPLCLVEVQGIAYELFAPMTTFYELPPIDETVSLFTHLVVREDAQTLYGFYTRQARTLFRLLIKTNGVGPKLALTILSGMSPDEFVQHSRQGDTAALLAIPGIGKKTAERLVIETRDVLKDWSAGTANTSLAPSSGVVQDAISALTSLGYKLPQAKGVVEAVHQAGQTSEALIRLALQSLSKGARV